MRTLRVTEVARKTGISKPTIWKWTRTGANDFPKPLHLASRVTVWDEDDIDQWLITRKQITQEARNETQ